MSKRKVYLKDGTLFYEHGYYTFATSVVTLIGIILIKSISNKVYFFIVYFSVLSIVLSLVKWFLIKRR